MWSVVISTNITLSSRKVKTHYESRHPNLNWTDQRVQAQNGTETILQKAVQKASDEHYNRKSNPSRKFWIRSTAPRLSKAQASRVSQDTVRQTVSVKTHQAVFFVLSNCYMELLISRIATPIFHGLVNMFDGRVQFTSKDSVKPYFILTYKSMWLLRREVTSALTGSITLDGGSAALGAPILGMTWHFTDDNWNL